MRSYKFRIYPNTTQRTKLAQCFGISRWAYNEGLSAIGFAYRTQGQRFTGIDCSRAVTELAKESDFEWINDAPRTVVTNALRNLDTAFKNFFAGRGKYPRFKKKLNKQTVTFQLDQRQNNWLAGRMLKLPGVGVVNVKWSRMPSGRPKMATVTRTETGKYFVSLSIVEAVEKLSATGKACGVDVGIKDLAITQDWKSGAPKYTAKYERKLRIAQRRLSRKTKGSKRWQHARIKVARIHEKIANSRADFIHKVSSHLIKSHDYLGIEDLNVKGMLKNRKLSKAISDAALSELHRQLKYKAEWYGRDLRQCSQWEPTSKTCHDCGAVNADLKLSDRDWTCECGSIHDRDTNAARNILRAAFGVSLEVTDVERELVGVAMLQPRRSAVKREIQDAEHDAARCAARAGKAKTQKAARKYCPSATKCPDPTSADRSLLASGTFSPYRPLMNFSDMVDISPFSQSIRACAMVLAKSDPTIPLAGSDAVAFFWSPLATCALVDRRNLWLS